MSGPRAPYPHLVNLLSEQLGAKALTTSDEWFAGIENLVRDAPAQFDPDTYGEKGKIMDGWESRRKRGPGHDWAILALAGTGTIDALDIDTAHFTGNHAPYARVEGLYADGDPSGEELATRDDWVVLLPGQPLTLGSHNHFPVRDSGRFTHVRLSIFPDGGVARLRAYGTLHRELEGQVDLAALENGGKALACSDMYFGVMDNLIAPGRAADMRSGWETRRRRGPGEDWVILRLADRGILDRLIVDTDHFKGNFPDTMLLEGIDWADGAVPDLLDCTRWETVVPSFKLSAHHAHPIDLDQVGPYTHLRLRIAPCGGISRLRVFGTAVGTSPDTLAQLLDNMEEETVLDTFLTCCGSERWAKQMANARPFHNRGALFTAARRFWWLASHADWREAFAHHPRIGENPDRLRMRFAHTAEQSSREQASIAQADEEVLERLTAQNLAYEDRFGHVFLVRATGRSASEMLAILNDRIRNTPERELREAAHQQAQITELRLLALEDAR